ncbi:hypothetical protein OEZ85_000293 [Tetradesmus obliquus]|uniref:Aldose 1-epimerase n=1 Tax=Tetradesmus obliquus TaxID=3088 RepID=A0ABY8UPT5_TETOB|nr:hypothetical protein OEZ85_000293 [Tetradesmus obliquus]
MDGNRRFADQLGQKRIDGHIQGYSKMKQIVQWCLELGISCVSVYAFSIDNFRRPADEVDALMELAAAKFDELAHDEDAKRWGAELRVVGDLSRAPPAIQAAAARLMQGSKEQGPTRSVVNICFSYTSSQELQHAVQQVAAGVAQSQLLPDDVTPQLLQQVMHTRECPPCMVITLQNKSNFSVTVTPIGASIQKLLVPDCQNISRQVDVMLGYEEVAGYSLYPHPSFGATVGRVGNRISGAQFSLNGETFKLEANEGNNTLHGGAVRWSKVMWSASVSSDKLTATFMRTSNDGEAGFPGNVRVMVMYSMPEEGSHLNVTMQAMTDKATPLNIINHAYFNLKGAASDSSVLDYVVKIPSNFYTPTTPGQLLPTGQIFRVKDTPYDFTTGRKVGYKLQAADGGLQRGYDVNYVVPQSGASDQQPVWWRPGENPQVGSDAAKRPLSLAATVTEPSTGMRLKVLTNAPGLQLYTGNSLTGKPKDMALAGKGGLFYKQYGGLCLSAQAFPNAINTPTFPSIVVRPGDMYSNRVSYDFSCAA